PEPEGAECTASLRLGNQWRDSGEVHFEAWVEVANTGGSPIDDWEIELAIDGTEVYRSWGMEHEGGDRYEAERWNSDIERGASAEAGFQGSVDDDVELPDTVPCSAFA
ncbi:cellulose binding domain-containing protein, partial [Glycomyces tenuis]